MRWEDVLFTAVAVGFVWALSSDAFHPSVAAEEVPRQMRPAPEPETQSPFGRPWLPN